ncbi:MAG: SLC13 family permease [Verrucomicrobiota bacterium]
MSDYYPFVILFIGMATVIGMIIGLRLNAFIALIAAALVVSFLAPGEIGDKVGRVASAFGSTAGGIAIVIAMAAVIGKCLMESGAADRIVQAFLKALGEKRSSLALAGSGFVLSIPVFFDTVFYLLVPLARSLYRNTGTHYLKYVLAISAGAAITHTLVPPTPGPLLMAQQLGVSLGTMIGVGALIGIPASIAGLAYGAWLDKKMPIEMRALPGDEDLHSEADNGDSNKEPRKTPGLLVSLLPILLPVVLIGINTVLETQANGERAAKLGADEKVNWSALKSEISKAGPNSPLKNLSDYLPEGNDQAALVAGFNKALVQKNKTQERKNLAYVEHENRKAFEGEVSEAILPHHLWLTPKRKQFNVSKFYGNANFALLLSAIIATLLFVQMRKPSKKEFSDTIEHALMSAGLIILITAAGGAFGAMLKEAEIGDAIKKLFTSQDPSKEFSGTLLLFLGFMIAAVIKIAQGSTTVAVITASSMIAAMIEGMTLGFNPVYLATAIGGGGLVGSWMNDSGFWIFSKMSGLTELESLKSWTPLLVVLGVVTFISTVILSIVMPLNG